MYLILSHLLQYFHSERERQQDWPALWWWLQRVVSSAGGMACTKATCFHFRGAAECCFVMAETVSDVQIVWKHVKTIPWYHVIRTESVDVGLLVYFGSGHRSDQNSVFPDFSRIFQMYFPGVHDHWHCRLHCNADGHWSWKQKVKSCSFSR